MGLPELPGMKGLFHMTLALYMHPLSSYSQKAVTAFYEKGVDFELKMLDNSEPVAGEFAALWPIRRFPILTDGDRMVFEATGIIEYLEAIRPGGTPLIPSDPVAAAEVRMWDRFFDNYINTPQQRVIMATLGREPESGPGNVHATSQLDTAYAVLDQRMAGREWVSGDIFSMADCAAAPALLYTDWTHPIPGKCRHLWAYRDRLLARPSYARALDEARPYRNLFPLPIPEGRD